MFIAKMTINDVPPFSGQVDFKFDERVNVFIGPNASGKSTLLQQLLDNYGLERAVDSEAGMSEPELSYINSQPVRLVSSEHFVFALEDHDAGRDRKQKYDVIIVPATRVRYGEAAVKQGVVMETEDHIFIGAEYLSEVLHHDHIHSTILALYRTIQGNAIDDEDVEETGHQYPDYEILGPWIEDGVKANPRKAGDGLNWALKRAHSCAKDICREIVMGNTPLNHWSVKEVQSDSGLPKLESQFELGRRVQTSDMRDEYRVPYLDMTQLSAGTEGTLWWIRLIALGLLLRNAFEPGWEKRRAILLIDEIENHLHPTWQRRVIPALLEHFPGLQIFATTHSPFVVAGLKAGQVHLLNRDENGVITATTNTEDIVGWTADEILRVYMGVDDPTDKETAEAAARLRQLRDEGPRADEKAEEARQAEMRRLRLIVDRAELSGPRAAEDDRFLTNLESILERYRQSQDLNQENQ